MHKKIETLQDAKDEIERALEGNRGYSRNIIGCCLRIVDKEFGTAAANDLVDDYSLEDMGFNKEPVN